jgi:signal peptidase I
MGERVVRAALTGLWLGVIPALLAGLAIRYLLPPALTHQKSALGSVARLASDLPITAAAVVFVLLVLLFHHWRFWLPGRRYLVGAPRLAPSRLRYWLGLAAGVVLAAFAAVLMHRLALQPFRVLSSSMLPTLDVGDDILVDRQAYSETRTPRRGDVVVFRYTQPGQPETQVKRIIGIPGDRVEMSGNRPVINGWLVPSCPAGVYALPAGTGIFSAALDVEYLGDSAYLTLQNVAADPFTGSVQLGEGSYFVLGDNRGGSLDSRSWNGGRGGGVRIQKIDGWARWILLARSHDGQFDGSRSLRAIGRDFSLEGMDTTALHERIERCLRERPQETLPPRPAPPSAAALEPAGHGT